MLSFFYLRWVEAFNYSVDGIKRIENLVYTQYFHLEVAFEILLLRAMKLRKVCGGSIFLLKS